MLAEGLRQLHSGGRVPAHKLPLSQSNAVSTSKLVLEVPEDRGSGFPAIKELHVDLPSPYEAWVCRVARRPRSHGQRVTTRRGGLLHICRDHIDWIGSRSRELLGIWQARLGTCSISSGKNQTSR